MIWLRDSLMFSLFYELNTSTSTFSQGLATTQQQGGGSASAVSGKYKSSCCVHHTDIHLHPEKGSELLLNCRRVVQKGRACTHNLHSKLVDFCVAGRCSFQPAGAAARGPRASTFLYSAAKNSCRLSSPCLARACARGPGPSLYSTLGKV